MTATVLHFTNRKGVIMVKTVHIVIKFLRYVFSMFKRTVHILSKWLVCWNICSTILPVDRVKNTTVGSDVPQSRSFLCFSFWLKYRHDGRPYCRSDEAISDQAHLEIPAVKEQKLQVSQTHRNTLSFYFFTGVTPRVAVSQDRTFDECCNRHFYRQNTFHVSNQCTKGMPSTKNYHQDLTISWSINQRQREEMCHPLGCLSNAGTQMLEVS